MEIETVELINKKEVERIDVISASDKIFLYRTKKAVDSSFYRFYIVKESKNGFLQAIGSFDVSQYNIKYKNLEHIQ